MLLINCITLLLFLLSCEEKKTTLVSYFDNKPEIQLQSVILVPEDKTNNPSELLCYDTLLILKNFMTPTVFTLVDTKSGNIIKDFGKSGTGPGEFVGNLQIDRSFQSGFINTPDNTQARMYQYCVDSILYSDNVQPRNLFSLAVNEKVKNIYYRILQVNDSIYVGTQSNGLERFLVFNINNNESYPQGVFPKDKNQQKLADEKMLPDAYQGYLRYNYSNNKMVFASANSEMIEIYKLDKLNLILEKGYYTSLPIYILRKTSDGARYLSMQINDGHTISLATSDRFIYQLLCNKGKEVSFYELLKSNLILVFDWDGKPIKKFILDCEVKAIEISPDEKRIYAIRDNPDPEVIYFDIK
jgi:hypothetical protein